MRKRKLRKLFKEVISGKKLQFGDKHGVVYLSEDCEFIIYRNYGQSAIKVCFQEFVWLMNVIFKGYKLKDIKIIEENK